MTQTLIKNLKQTRVREAPNVVNLIAGGANLEIEAGLQADAEALLETYKTRAEHLTAFTTHHAQRLKKSTEELRDNLAALGAATTIGHARIDDTLLGSYFVWYVIDTEQPVGCLYVIGKSEVDEATWERLWQDED